MSSRKPQGYEWIKSKSVAEIQPRMLHKLPDRDFKDVARRILAIQQRDRKENALLYYQPASEGVLKVHQSMRRFLGVGGGNASSKTEGCLAEMVACATGVIPESLRDELDWSRKLRGPIQCRLVCESLTTVLYPTILPKLQWFKWTGIDAPGGERGHWGWVPRACLVGGSWERSWSDKFRVLRILYRNPDNWDEVIGESSIQFCSIDQDPSDFASGEFHYIMHDEPPPYAIWRENEARVMRVNGRMVLAMTWPDDPAIPVDWIFDQIYEPATSGTDPEKEWINLFTTENRFIDQTGIVQQMKTWSPEIVKVRIYGQPIRFSNRVHPDFTDQTLWWCFDCKKSSVVEKGRCVKCGSVDVIDYNHVTHIVANPTWPTVFLLDPHPRKPHMFQWVQIDPKDDLWQVAEGQIDGDPVELKRECDRIEGELGLHVTQRLIDPNMGRSPAGVRRKITWQDEFDAVGLHCDLADDSDVGRERFNEYLKPDARTHAPRVHIDVGCTTTIQQIKRYIWDEYKQSLDKDQKQKPKTKNDDHPTLWKYLLNQDPSFRQSFLATQYMCHRGQRREESKRPFEYRSVFVRR
ncbi:hypothetical protein AMJ82_11550 [candidate division TA06 bacterium SM23_40]|uniref:Terminase n=1 Tax=candidate division TA06 bacterium SM23_40 TaxID=1703774 RepID=A0A0S8G1R1_UNCT6|nr:MAG: hypothetical protein AMJ82_11550 [candidate division TA06 bacterium SM23_40]